MDYAAFQRLRQPIWENFERQLGRVREHGRAVGYAELEAAAVCYRQVLHDHALAASRFPGTGAARRLAGLALEGTRLLSHEARGRSLSPLRFFFSTFPTTFRRQLPVIGVVVALFLAAWLLGLVLTLTVPGFGGAFLGPEQIAGLKQGRLWTESLTSTVPPTVSSSAIAQNNLSVALAAWAGGATAGLFSLWIVVVNGLMLGAVIAVTMHYGMAGALFEFIAAHGPLELTVIVVSAASGLVMARGFIAAEDRPRAEVIRKAAEEAFVLVLGSLPWLVVLAIIEGTVSPSPSVAPATKLAIGLALETIFLSLALRPVISGRPADV